MLRHLTFMLVASHAVQKRMREDKGGGGLEEGVHLAELGGWDGGGAVLIGIVQAQDGYPKM